MPYYRDADGAVKYFASIAYAAELPAGSTIISDEEAFTELPTPLNDAISNQIQQVDAACAAAITGGFLSSALGTPYTYPSQQTDQANLSAAVQMSTLPGQLSSWSVLFWCADRYGSWGMRGHNAAQIQQVGKDGFAWISKCIATKAALEMKIAACTEAEDVLQFVWVTPT